jgi:hypothetical protein
MKSTHPLASATVWSPPVYFTPVVGEHYDDGLVDGVRVLILGESHYASIAKQAEWGRDCTQINYDDYTDDSCNFDNESQFFKKLPRILTRKTDVTMLESAAAWRRIAFSNFVQEFVGEFAGIRPKAAQWKQGQLALTELADKLDPHVILVLGSKLWDHIKKGRSSEEHSIAADHRDRYIWLIPTKSGFARSSWIFHPCTNRERLCSAIGVFEELLKRAAADLPTSRA